MIRQILVYKLRVEVEVSLEPEHRIVREHLFLADHAVQAVRQAAAWAAKADGNVTEFCVRQVQISRPGAINGLMEMPGGARPPLFSWTAALGELGSAVARWAAARPQSVTPVPTGGAAEAALAVLGLLECPASRELTLTVADFIDRETMLPELLSAAERVTEQVTLTVEDAEVSLPALKTLTELVSLLRCRRRVGGLPPPRVEPAPVACEISD